MAYLETTEGSRALVRLPCKLKLDVGYGCLLGHGPSYFMVWSSGRCLAIQVPRKDQGCACVWALLAEKKRACVNS